jgi:cysteinyl-tRNA synthetase
MLHLYNTLTRKKETFTPEDPEHVRMYVCGPTVYDRAHLGNARSVVVYDVLFRILRHLYGEERVVYVRNITDVDDKINARAKERNISIQTLTTEVTGWFHTDMDALANLSPDYEPRATGHITQMICLIEALIKRGVAYIAGGHVLFAVEKYADYGKLSGRKIEEQQAGARVQVEGYKRHAGDFVLWKPTDDDDDESSVFDSPWGKGRPGWHIECSAMSMHYLGESFDIHGGGADLMFPHHENEIAQSCGSGEHVHFARVWVHNGFLTVGGEKMSKSLGNFITVRDLLDKGIKGEVIRLALLSAKYNEPLDFNDKLVSDAEKILDGFYRKIAGVEASQNVPKEFLDALYDDMNLPKAFSYMHAANAADLKRMGILLGFFNVSSEAWFHAAGVGDMSEADILAAIEERKIAKQNKEFTKADAIRAGLADRGVILEDKAGGVVEWRRT